jgi:glutamate synthase (NADPH/NADH) small chain
VCLAIGAQLHRDVRIPGRDLGGVHYAVQYLIQENRRQAGRPVSNRIHAQGKDVIVLGGGDTGADCVATAHRQGAKQVTQISINFKPPSARPFDNPWPEFPRTYTKTYAQQEGGIEEYNINTAAFVDTDGDGRVNELRVERVEWEYEGRKRVAKKVLEPNVRIPADLVLIAIGFEGAEMAPLEGSGLEMTDRGTIKIDANMMTNLPGVFAAGDANRGQSIVVWAIGEGRDVARSMDIYLTGDSQLPASLRTPNPPLGL